MQGVALRFAVFVLAFSFCRDAGGGWLDRRFDVAGANGPIRAVEVFGGNIYAIGDFSRVSGVAADRIARWDGERWHAVGLPVSGSVHEGVVAGNALYLSVCCNTNVALLRWDELRWEAIPYPQGYQMAPQGSPAPILSNVGDAVFVQVNQIPVPGAVAWQRTIFRWDGKWTQLAELGSTIPGEMRLVEADGAVYGGLRTFIGRLEQGRFHGLGVGPGTVSGIATDGKSLLARGTFEEVAGQVANGFAIYGAGEWFVPPGTLVDFAVESLTSNPGEVLASELTLGIVNNHYGAVISQAIASYAGTNRTELLRPNGPGMAAIRRTASGDLVAGGTFSKVDNVGTGNIAYWNGTTWEAMKSRPFEGLDNTIYCLRREGSNVYAGGSFQIAGGVVAGYIARWDGERWRAMGDGLPERVWHIEAEGGEVLAFTAGRWTEYLLGTSPRAWRWNGQKWEEITREPVMATTETAEGILVAEWLGWSRFALSRWRDGSWETMMEGDIQYGENGAIHALAIDERGGILVGGRFNSIGGIAANGIARWADGRWSSLGEGISGQKEWIPNELPFSEVRAILLKGDEVWVGGAFMRAGGQAATNVARWDGERWHPLGQGLPGVGNCVFGRCTFPVTSLISVGDKIYAGGGFTTDRSRTEGFLSSWDGTRWMNVVSGWAGAAAHVFALETDGTNLFLGGNFSQIGWTRSYRFAIWRPDSELVFKADKRNEGVTISWPASAGHPLLEWTGSLAESPWVPVEPEPHYDSNSGRVSVRVEDTQAAGFYRFRLTD